MLWQLQKVIPIPYLKVRSVSPDPGGSSLYGMELLADYVERCRDTAHVF